MRTGRIQRSSIMKMRMWKLMRKGRHGNEEEQATESLLLSLLSLPFLLLQLFFFIFFLRYHYSFSFFFLLISSSSFSTFFLPQIFAITLTKQFICLLVAALVSGSGSRSRGGNDSRTSSLCCFYSKNSLLVKHVI